MCSIPKNIYLAKQVRELDRIAIEEFKVASFDLMQRAGSAAFAAIQQHWPSFKKILVFAGPGNNGGDGYVIAALALKAGLQAEVMQVADHSKLKGDAKKAHDEFIKLKGRCLRFPVNKLPECDVIVDAMLGTGLTREVEGDFKSAIDLINNSSHAVLSADIPSGLDADCGVELGSAVVADITVTFVGMKLGLVTGAGRRYSGKVIFNDLEIPSQVYQSMPATCEHINLQDLTTILGKRKGDAHKGNFGHVLVVGGNQGMAGSVMLAAEAAARTGAGLVSVATIPQHVTAAVSTCREVMVHAVENIQQLEPLLKRVTVIAIGPGLGQDAWAKKLLARVLELKLPLVLDADALNLLSQEPAQNDSWVLTPHPGEAARLLNSTSSTVQNNRLQSAQDLQKKYKGICVLKGSGSLIVSNQQCSICSCGNPGMATGGMGDVLTGIIAGLIAQGLSLYDAARFGVQLHAESADIAAQDGQRGMMASDLFVPLRNLVNVTCN